MISIPDINQEELLNDCIDGIQVKDVETRERKTRIENSKQSLLDYAGHYKTVAEIGGLSAEEQNSEINGGATKSDMVFLYDERLVKSAKPNDWMKGMEYVPNHVLLKPREQEKPVLILDVDFLRTLDAVEAGYPIGLLAPQYEQTVTRFLRQLDDYNLTEDNDDGEIIIANRKKSYKKSIYVIDNKYNFEEED